MALRKTNSEIFFGQYFWLNFRPIFFIRLIFSIDFLEVQVIGIDHLLPNQSRSLGKLAWSFSVKKTSCYLTKDRGSVTKVSDGTGFENLGWQKDMQHNATAWRHSRLISIVPHWHPLNTRPGFCLRARCCKYARRHARARDRLKAGLVLGCVNVGLY